MPIEMVLRGCRNQAKDPLVRFYMTLASGQRVVFPRIRTRRHDLWKSLLNHRRDI